MMRLLLVAALVAAASGALVNKDVTREIDATTHLVHIETSVTVSNTGSSAASEYKLAHDAALKDHLAYVEVKNGEDTVPVKGDSVKVSIPAGGEVTLDISAIYTHSLTPYPAKIKQDEPQLVVLEANTYFTSPYETTTQKTTVKIGGKAESYSKNKPVKSADGAVTYGPYENVAANSELGMRVHFENHSPFLTVTNLVREFEVSHWGNVAITETIDMEHSGAKLDGTFSRLDFQRNPRASINSVREFTSRLPAAAQDVYYRDVIGNISTSHLREEDDAVIFEVRPRYPLFGGWKTQYTVGYNLPAYEVLSSSGGKYTLRVRFVDHIYDNQVVDKAVVRVALPEGASNIKFSSAVDVDRQEEDVLVSYLDTSGRPVLVLHASNLVEEETEELEVTYDFSQSSLIREPMMVVIFFFAIFLVVIVINRIDFSIDTSSKAYQHEVARKKAEYYIESIGELFDNNSIIFNTYLQAAADGRGEQDAFERVKRAKHSLEKFRDLKGKIDQLEAGISSDIHAVVALEQKRFESVEKVHAAGVNAKMVEGLQKQLDSESDEIVKRLDKLSS